MFDIEKFSNLFKFDESGLNELNIFENSKYGIYLIVSYPNYILPNVTFFNSKSNVSMIRIYVPKEERNKTFTLKKINIDVKFVHRMENSKDFDYDIYLRQDEAKPITIEFQDTFFYDEFSNKLFYNDTVISSEILIKKLLEYHFINRDFFLGFCIRSQIFKKDIFKALLKVTYYILDISNLILFHERKNILVMPESKYIRVEAELEEQAMEAESSKNSTEFYGIKTDIWSISSYSFIFLCIYKALGFLGYTEQIKEIISNSMLSLLFVFITFNLYNHGLRRLLIFLRDTVLKKYNESIPSKRFLNKFRNFS